MDCNRVLTSRKCRVAVIFLSLLTILIIIVCYWNWNSAMEAVSVSDLWPDVRTDLTQVTWAHAVNSKNKLEEAINDDGIMMLEADVSVAREARVPIMAHPPDVESDLTLEQFVSSVAHAVQIRKLKKGIKLDFKDAEVLDDSIKILKEMNQITFPIWLNADILSGPGSTKMPLDGDLFLEKCSQFKGASALSLGWTTGVLQSGRYEERHIDEMRKKVGNRSLDSVSLTFAVRASFLGESNVKLFFRLLQGQDESKSDKVNKATLTIWTDTRDDVDWKRLAMFISEIGRDRIFLDIPLDQKEKLLRY